MQTDASLILCSYDNVTVKTCSHFCWFQEHCRTLNADLVSIHDDKELLSALCLTWRINHERHTIWIGARRSEVNCECLRELNHGWMEDYVCYPSSLILTFLFFRESLNGLMDPHLRIICGILVNQTTLMEKRTASSPTIAVSQKNKKSSKKGFSFKNGWRPKINDWIRKKISNPEVPQVWTSRTSFFCHKYKVSPAVQYCRTSDRSKNTCLTRRLYALIGINLEFKATLINVFYTNNGSHDYWTWLPIVTNPQVIITRVPELRGTHGCQRDTETLLIPHCVDEARL